MSYIGKEAACEYMGGISIDSLDRRRKEGLRWEMVGGIVVFKIEWIDAFIASSKRPVKIAAPLTRPELAQEPKRGAVKRGKVEMGARA